MEITGMVIEGNNRGKRLGFPTLNVAMGASLPEGIYISRTEIDGETYNSLTFIGSAKTYDETVYQSETYVFDFDRDIYGQTVIVTLLEKIRDNEKFVSEEKLIEQMEEYNKKALAFFEDDKGSLGRGGNKGE
jgi:riboflavin kinase/FMN adenylyltransferase